MGVSIIRTSSRPSTCPDADAIQPRLDIAPFPHPIPHPLSIALSSAVSPLGILGPIECEATAYQPFANVGTVHHACRDRSSVAIETDRIAVHRTACDEHIETVRSLRPALILFAVVVSAQLRRLGHINPPQPNSDAVDFERIAIDDARPPKAGRQPTPSRTNLTT
jgi:hypothetical protein